MTVISESVLQIFPTGDFELYLFGSRTNDQKKGGDIDLLLIVEEKKKSQFVNAKARIKTNIFKTLDEQKIDITVATKAEMMSDAFLTSIIPDLVRLS